jgi:hypothetical protein
MVGIVFIGNIEYCPYLKKYEQALIENNVKYEVLFWNRENSKDKYPDNYLSFEKKMNNRKKKISKLLYFLQFALWLKRRIKSGEYDKLIILDTMSGMLLSKELLSKYKNKYIFDIRDYSYEKLRPFFKLEEKIINLSYFTCISSEGFKSFLPKDYQYILAHNFNYSDLLNNKEKSFSKKKYGSKLNLVWIGSVRYYEHQATIINKLGNDRRFQIVFHGTGPDLERLQSYVEKKKIKNIKFTGKYNNDEKNSLLSNADIINNSYDINIGEEVKYAIANKFYDGMVYRVPQLIEVGSYKQQKVEELSVGIGYDVNENDFPDKLYNYYFNIDERKFNENCTNELEKVLKDDQTYLRKIKEFII